MRQESTSAHEKRPWQGHQTTDGGAWARRPCHVIVGTALRVPGRTDVNEKRLWKEHFAPGQCRSGQDAQATTLRDSITRYRFRGCFYASLVDCAGLQQR